MWGVDRMRRGESSYWAWLIFFIIAIVFLVVAFYILAKGGKFAVGGIDIL